MTESANRTENLGQALQGGVRCLVRSLPQSWEVGADCAMCRCMGSLWVHLSFSRTSKRSTIMSTVLPWRAASIGRFAGEGARMGSLNAPSHLPCSDLYNRKLGELQANDFLFIAHQVEDNVSAGVGRNSMDKL